MTDCFSPLPDNAYLSLMTLEQPKLCNEVLEIGKLGKIYLDSGCSVEIEEIKLTDHKLMNEWGDKLYRTKIYIKSPQFTFTIKD